MHQSISNKLDELEKISNRLRAPLEIIWFIVAFFPAIIGYISLRFDWVEIETLTLYLVYSLFLFIGAYFTLKGYLTRKTFLDSLVNPNISIKNREVNIKINEKKGCTRKETFIFEKLKKEVNEYKFSVDKGISGEIDLDVIKGGTILKNDSFPKHIEYTILFEGSDNKNHHEVVLLWKVKKIQPFISSTFNNCRDYENVTFVISFPKKLCCKKVFHYIHKAKSKKIIGEKGCMELDCHQTVTWKIGKGTDYPCVHNQVYTLFWKW
jgi:hypothetical protein